MSETVIHDIKKIHLEARIRKRDFNCLIELGFKMTDKPEGFNPFITGEDEIIGPPFYSCYAEEYIVENAFNRMKDLYTVHTTKYK